MTERNSPQLKTLHTAVMRAIQQRALGSRALALSLALVFTSNTPLVYGQADQQGGPALADNPKANDQVGSPLDNLMEPLRSKRKRPAIAQNRPYNPIKKQDDQEQIPEIEMFVGESRVFPSPGVGRIAVGNGQVMSAAALDNKEVIIFANAVGTSSLFVWNEDGRYQRVKVNIVPGDTSRFAREIAAFLTAIPNAKASIIGDKVIVEGDNLPDLDIAKIDELAKRYPQIVNFTNRLGWEQTVLMDVKVVEFPTNKLRDIGLKWSAVGGGAVGGIWSPGRRGHGPYQISVQGGPISSADNTSGSTPVSSSLNVLSALNLGLNAQLNLLAQDGHASILAEPQLSARNGSKASFLAGGEFPYTVTTIAGPTVLFKPYGVKLDIFPRVDRSGVVRATIDSEVSSIDTSLSTPSGPALRTRKTNTEFNVKNGETIVLSGLLQRNSSTDINKVPLLGDIPVLGALFRSKRFQNDETELVVFVTPTVVDSHSPGLVDRVARTKERLQETLGKPPYLSEPLQPGIDPASEPSSKSQSVRGSVVGQRGQQVATIAPAKVQTVQPIAVKSVDSTPVTPSSQNPLQPISKSAKAAGETLQVKLDGLVVRARPTVKSEALLQLGYGSIVQRGKKSASPANAGSWRNVVVGEIDGWVISRGVESSPNAPIIKPYGGPIARVDQQGKTLGLGSNNPEAALKSAGTKTVTANGVEEAKSPKRYRVSLERLALRVTPDVNAPIVQHLAPNTLVEALPQAPRGHWVAVQVDDKRGWAASQWLVPAQ